MLATVLDPRSIRDISPLLLNPQGHLRSVPAAVLAQTTREERALFGVRHGIYGLLTDELLAWLRERIGTRSALEVGAGHGRLAAELGIPATDSRLHEDPAVRAYYELLGQPAVSYGANVQKLDAEEAVRTLRPQVVIASWVTHKYDPAKHRAEGNMAGVREEQVIAGCEEYVFIGNTRVHEHKSIWALPHERFSPPWLYSRAGNGSPDFIAVWRRDTLGSALP